MVATRIPDDYRSWENFPMILAPLDGAYVRSWIGQNEHRVRRSWNHLHDTLLYEEQYANPV